MIYRAIAAHPKESWIFCCIALLLWFFRFGLKSLGWLWVNFLILYSAAQAQIYLNMKKKVIRRISLLTAKYQKSYCFSLINYHSFFLTYRMEAGDVEAPGCESGIGLLQTHCFFFLLYFKMVQWNIIMVISYINRDNPVCLQFFCLSVCRSICLSR